MSRLLSFQFRQRAKEKWEIIKREDEAIYRLLVCYCTLAEWMWPFDILFQASSLTRSISFCSAFWQVSMTSISPAFLSLSPSLNLSFLSHALFFCAPLFWNQHTMHVSYFKHESKIVLVRGCFTSVVWLRPQSRPTQTLTLTKKVSLKPHFTHCTFKVSDFRPKEDFAAQRLLI